MCFAELPRLCNAFYPQPIDHASARQAYSGMRIRDRGLGGHRLFSDDERRLAGLAGLDELDSEFSALDAGVRTAFDVTVAPSTRSHEENSVGGSWTAHEYQTDGLQLTVAAAPSSEPHARRANTADAYLWLARIWSTSHAGSACSQ